MYTTVHTFSVHEMHMIEHENTWRLQQQNPKTANIAQSNALSVKCNTATNSFFYAS